MKIIDDYALRLIEEAVSNSISKLKKDIILEIGDLDIDVKAEIIEKTRIHERAMNESFNYYKLSFDDLSNEIANLDSTVERIVLRNLDKEIINKTAGLFNKYQVEFDLINKRIDGMEKK